MARERPRPTDRCGDSINCCFLRRSAAQRSLELQDHRVDGEAVAGLGVDRLDRAGFFGAQDILHLHRLDHGERLAGLDPVALADMERGRAAPASGRSDIWKDRAGPSRSCGATARRRAPAARRPGGRRRAWRAATAGPGARPGRCARGRRSFPEQRLAGPPAPDQLAALAFLDIGDEPPSKPSKRTPSSRSREADHALLGGGDRAVRAGRWSSRPGNPSPSRSTRR